MNNVRMLEIKENVPLKDYCTFRIGGPAKYFVNWKERQQIEDIVKFAKEKDMPLFVFGGGTNLLFPDEGLEAVVVRTMTSNIELENDIIEVEAGVNWVKLQLFCKQSQLYGLEAFSGLPGLIGGAVYGNAGAHGVEMKDVLTKIEAYDTDSEDYVTIDPTEAAYDYRHSMFKKKKNLIITRAWLKVSKNPDDNTGDPTDFANFRKENQPQGLTTGSFFKNPPNNFAGKLIEECGLKGKQIGGVQTSDKHANFFINTGNGTAEDVINFKNTIIEAVKDQKGITLEPEVQIIKSE